jgi:hypothetical protein
MTLREQVRSKVTGKWYDVSTVTRDFIEVFPKGLGLFQFAYAKILKKQISGWRLK